MQAYLARSVCAMDMVDSALKTLDLTLLKYDKSFGTLAQGKCFRTGFDGVLRAIFVVRFENEITVSYEDFENFTTNGCRK